MSEPQIIPPTPVINQGDPVSSLPADSAEKIASTQKSVTDIMDRIMPLPKGTQTPPPTPPATEPTPTTPTPPATPTPPTPTDPTPPKTPDPTRAPSFIEESLRGTATPPAASQNGAEEDWPEEPPTFETPEARTTQYKKWRSEYQRLKDEARRLREQPSIDPQVQERVKLLEGENKTMQEQLAMLGVERNMEFQRTVIQPMTQAWQTAARTLKEAGGDPDALAKALNLTGAAQYTALDEVYSEIPESAKLEIQQSVSAYKHYASQRAAALKDAPKTAAELKKRELERNYQFIENQKKEMAVIYDNVVAKLRDEAKLEVLQKSSDPEHKWWNDQADNYVALGRELFLENTDFSKMAMAAALAPFADVYRKMWAAAVQRAEKAEGILAQKFGSEPTISESSGNVPVPGAMPSLAEDLKKPFKDVFLREFHRQQAAGVT